VGWALNDLEVAAAPVFGLQKLGLLIRVLMDCGKARDRAALLASQG